MDIIRVMNDPQNLPTRRELDAGLPRLVAGALAERLAAMPVVVLTGARQTGKSTLAQALPASASAATSGRGARSASRAPTAPRRYVTLDDMDVLDAAQRNPDLLVGGTDPVTIDEIQRAPDLLSAVKRAVDRSRTPGRFLLTGSANLDLMRGVSESLAGRATALGLWPMTRREQLGLGTCGLWEHLVSTPEGDWIDVLAADAEATGELRADWRVVARRGGFPTPAVHMRTDRERAIWHEGYVRTYLERDLQQLSAISSLPDFRRLMRAACVRLGQLVNQTELGRDVGLPQTSIHRHLNLLEISYILIRIPAFAVNRTKRLIKSPKLYWADTALALHLSGDAPPEGAHLENLILTDLLAWRDSRLARAEIAYWRTASGEEVDFVIEADELLVPIEIKSSGRPTIGDTSHLRTFISEYAPRARAGLLLHTGTSIEWIAPNVLTVPWWRAM